MEGMILNGNVWNNQGYSLYSLTLYFIYVSCFLKMEKSIKSFYLAEILFLIADTVFILFDGYLMYLERLEFSKKYSDFPVSPMPFVVERLTAPIILWVSMLFLLLLTLFMIKKEKKRVSDMLNYLNKSFNPVRIFFSKKETAEQVRNFILKK